MNEYIISVSIKGQISTNNNICIQLSHNCVSNNNEHTFEIRRHHFVNSKFHGFLCFHVFHTSPVCLLSFSSWAARRRMTGPRVWERDIRKAIHVKKVKKIENEKKTNTYVIKLKKIWKERIYIKIFCYLYILFEDWKRQVSKNDTTINKQNVNVVSVNSYVQLSFGLIQQRFSKTAIYNI